jgi:sporulation integral membrane protein YtvI
MENMLQDALNRGVHTLQDMTSSVINGLVGFLTALPGLLIFMMIALEATYFMMRDRAVIRSYLYDALPDKVRNLSRGLIAELIKAFTGFLRAYAILIAITTIITLVSLKILGVNYVVTIAIIVGLADILPVLGPGTIFVPWIIWQFISDHTGMGVSLLIVFLLITAIRQFLEPKIVGDNIGLHPLVTLISLYVGLQLGGVVGLILGPVCVVIVIAAYRAGVFDRFDWRKKC